MDNYVTKQVAVRAEQWIPGKPHSCVPPYRKISIADAPESELCEDCGRALREHGLYPCKDTYDLLVCPSNWFVEGSDGSHGVIGNEEFKATFIAAKHNG